MNILLIGKDLILGKIEGRRRKGLHRIRCLDGINDSMNMSWSKLQEIVKDREAWHGIAKRVGYNLPTEQQQQHVYV